MVNLPEPFASVPFHRLRYPRPSPIHEFANHTVDSSSPIQVWAKRDDQSAPLVCCGNKYRKLEYIIPDILATPGVTTLVTEGGLQSNHAAQTAVVAAKLGLECVLLLDERSGGLSTAENPNIFRSAGNFQVYNLFGAQTRVHSGQCNKDDILSELRSQGKVPYWIPSGASLHPLGGLGYAQCAFEIAKQEAEMDLGGTGRFDYIFLPCGSGSTIAGLIAGFRLLEKTSEKESVLPKRQIIGVMVSPKTQQEERVLSIARTVGDKIGLDSETDLSLNDVRLDHRFCGPGYGVFDNNLQNTLCDVAVKEGILMDPVYSGKAARGMLSFLSNDEMIPDSMENGYTGFERVNVLFIHTGGQTVFSAYAPLPASV